MPGVRSVRAGFTLVELLIAIAIVGILSAIAIPNYLRYLEKNKEITAISDIVTIAGKLKGIMMENPEALPAGLAQINVGNYLPLIDPWGNPYQYLRLYGLTKPQALAAGCRRKQNITPVSTDFDLYSMGPDGVTEVNLKSAKAKDDIVRGDDGAYVGVANGFEP